MWPLSHWMICSANQMQVMTWTLDAYDFALSSTKQRFIMGFPSISVEHNPLPPPSPPPYRCLTLFAGFLLLKIQKVFLILTAVIRTAVNYCFHCKSIDNCHGDMALKGWDFYWEGNHSKLTLLHACGHFALFRLIISVWLQFACNLFTACVNTFNFSPTSLSLEVHVKCLALLSGG